MLEIRFSVEREEKDLLETTYLNHFSGIKKSEFRRRIFLLGLHSLLHQLIKNKNNPNVLMELLKIKKQ